MDFLGLGELDRLEFVLAICALVGGVLFLLRMVLFAIGIGDDVSDFDADADLDGGGGGAGLSVHGLTAFFMMFGLVGLAMLRSGANPTVAILVGAAAGGLALWLSSQLYRFFIRLQSSGNVKLDSAVGAEGTVYLTIPAGDTGKVQVVVGGRLRTFDARSRSDEDLKTGDPVRIVAVSGEAFIVEKA